MNVRDQGRPARRVRPEAKHVGIENRPAVGEPRIVQQLLDQLLAAILGIGGGELCHFCLGRNSADQIDIHPPQENLVADNRHGLELQPSRFVFGGDNVVQLSGPGHCGLSQ